MESLLHPISSEIDLRNSERDVVENAVQKLVDATYADLTLRNHLDLNGTLTFESHTNLGIDLMLAEIRDRQPLGSINCNRQSRKRKWVTGKHVPDAFSVEVQSLRANLT
ncbi:hypothetical protein H9L39_16923 [Fusarium oxysporum f. sp. albedinis]|nr:hypothetical protein H9L39_16923 [Fusarium oxysporum f. sp. albedinis]